MKDTFSELNSRFFINPSGAIRLQNPVAKTPQSLCSIQRFRVNNLERLNTIQVLTGMTHPDLLEMMALMAVEWLCNHLTPSKKLPSWASDVESDVYQLLQNQEVVGWWRNQHYIRDEGMLSILCTHHQDAYTHAREQKRYNKKDSKRFAQDSTKEKYNRLHRMCMDSKFYHYQKLEDSYAKLW